MRLSHLFLIILTLSFSSAYSQIDFGARVNLGTAFTDVSTTSEEISNGDAEFGFGVGVFTRFGSEKIKIMPELLYTTTKTSIDFNNGVVSEILEADLDKIDVPVTLVFKPSGLFNLQGGIIGSYILSDGKGVVNNTEEAFRNYRDFTIGYQFGGGVEFGNFIVDLQYESSLSDITQANSLAGFAFDERISMVKGGLGIKIF